MFPRAKALALPWKRFRKLTITCYNMCIRCDHISFSRRRRNKFFLGRKIEALKVSLIALLILAIVAAVSMPVGHATNNVHTFFTNVTTVGTCGTLCKGLQTTSGTASTSTVETSIAIGSSPTKDSNSASNKAATWSSGTTISITTFATAGTADTILIFVAASGTITQNAPSATGFTCDATVRKNLSIIAGVDLSEWVCHTSAAISSETVTVSLSGTPTWGIAQIISVTGSEDPTGTFSPFDQNSGFVYNGNRNTGGGTAAPTVATVSSSNADDLFVSATGDTGANTQTAGAIGGTT